MNDRSRDTEQQTLDPPSAADFGARASVEVLPEPVRGEMRGVTWHPDRPGPSLDELALIRMPYWSFGGVLHDGELVVAAAVATDVLSVFLRLFQAQFPIARMERAERHRGDDDALMAANNTSGFNGRYIRGSRRLSAHAYGTAIDINPVQNPAIRDGSVRPAEGASYLDRSFTTPGLIADGGVVVEAFADIGWEWGGHWGEPRDYHHFQRRR